MVRHKVVCFFHSNLDSLLMLSFVKHDIIFGILELVYTLYNCCY